MGEGGKDSCGDTLVIEELLWAGQAMQKKNCWMWRLS